MSECIEEHLTAMGERIEGVESGHLVVANINVTVAIQLKRRGGT